ncbi:hypothetical protein F5Y13DRAFT_170191 [Hypoxylon sp. FL1857]|nr:hypothetical protein F5Y13DRAFT_170191 [Hypoxylon sp. FL1857]
MSEDMPQEDKMALKAAAATLKRIVSNVEVERKFNPGSKFTSLLASYTLTSLQGQPQGSANRRGLPFAVINQPGQLIRDTYYDTQESHLCALGLWIRQRTVNTLPLGPDQATADRKGDAEWNAKVRLGGNFGNSQFAEYDGKAKVAEEVLRITNSKMRLEDLQVASDLLTRRTGWKVVRLADGTAPEAEMTIVVDEVTEADGDKDEKSAFKHTIGEVELFQEVVTDEKDKEEHEAYRKEISAQMMGELEEFMLAHPDLFSTNPKPIGKLSAYDTWRAARGQS